MPDREALVTIRATDTESAYLIKDAIAKALSQAMPDLNTYVGTDTDGNPLTTDATLPYVIVLSARST